MVPERHGEPSVIEHVIYIIKENRTYDQVFGDMKEGNGDPKLCIFGEEVTPNHHKLAREFVLLDNFYCSGVLSADGHSWANNAYVTDYLEKSFGGFVAAIPTKPRPAGLRPDRLPLGQRPGPQKDGPQLRRSRGREGIHAERHDLDRHVSRLHDRHPKNSDQPDDQQTGDCAVHASDICLFSANHA